MICDGVDPLQGRDDLVELLRRDPYIGGHPPPEVPEASLLQVDHPGEAGVRGEDPGPLVVGYGRFEPRQVRYGGDDLGEDGVVYRRRALGGPDEPLEAVAGVDDVVLHPIVPLSLDLVFAPRRDLHIHEDEGCELQAADHHLDAGSGVPPSGPGRLLVGDGQGIGPQAQKELVAEGDGPVLPVDLLLGGVEDVVGHHLEGGEVAAAPPDGVEVVEPDAGLGYRQGVCGRRYEPRGDEGLKVGDGGYGEVDVVPPPSDDRIPLYPGVAPSLKEGEVVLPHLVQSDLPAEDRRSNEGVGVAGWVSAGGPGGVPRPETAAAPLAGLPGEALVFEELQIISVLGEHFDQVRFNRE